MFLPHSPQALWTPPPILAAAASSLALDGSAQGPLGSGNTTCTVTLTTTNANDLIVVSLVSNDSNPSQTVTVTGAGLTWSQRLDQNTGSTSQHIRMFTAVAASPLSAQVITCTIGTGVYSFGVASAFGISGANTGSPFDAHSGLPVGGTSDPLSISTTSSKDFIIGMFRMGATSSPTAGSGWTTIIGANNQLVEYQIVSSPQTSLSVTIGTGVGDSNAGIADAIVGL
jgi:hypothetical protein